MNIASMIKHRDKAPTNALIAQSVSFLCRTSIRYLLYQHFAYGNKKPDSPDEVQRSNGFQRVDLPRYYVSDSHRLGGLPARPASEVR